ncbi:NADH-quinone oxidoreductase subunit NuoN [Thioalkalivibrio sp. ALE16]|uniref:NADH-quinone oxidoreductase subunit NuoN n=1 Tax=Thioalkalivibrio sp. ALE16 TaxID=1158172 RepID=UPI00035C2F93|nr:NADH-quinone oxidoreductase subunit NuoN [Thioalkalivibrio sp. ALE16]
MNFEIPNFLPAVPEMFVLGMACLILVIDAFLPDSRRDVTYGLVQATLVAAAGLTLWLMGPETVLTFSDTFVKDPMADILKVAVYVTSFLVFLYSRPYLMERGIHKGEFYVLGLFAVLGMMIMISGHNLLTLYLGLELLSLASYALVAFWRDNSRATEAAMKYFVLGALASGLLLYGMSMIYGMTGSLDIAVIAAQLVAADESLNIPLVFGLVFLVVAIAFKLGAVPFHMWVPDVYDGAPTAVTLFIATAPKIAAFAFLMRLLVEGMGPMHADWQGMLIILAVLSLAVGNVIAIAQTSIKRMLAYSTIAHIGFLFMGILAGTDSGYAAAMFYVIVYAITAAGGFGMIVFLSRKGYEADQIDDFKGLAKRNPWFAFIMLLLLFSMAGVPPTVGFYAKLAVIQAAVGAELVWLAIVAVIFSIIGAFYYLRVVKMMFFDDPQEGAEEPVQPSGALATALSINGLAVLLLGIFPGLLLSLTHYAIIG